MKAIGVLISILVIGNVAMTQVNWVRFESLSDSMGLTPKPIVVFIHAPWCNYCKMMQKFVFKDDVLSRLLNQDYYSIALDAETTDTIRYRGMDFAPEMQPNGKLLNRLAMKIGAVDGKLTYPTTVFLESNLNVVAQFQGYLNKDEFGIVLKTLTK